MSNEKAPNNTKHYEGLSAPGLKKGGDAFKKTPKEAYDKAGGQGRRSRKR